LAFFRQTVKHDTICSKYQKENKAIPFADGSVYVHPGSRNYLSLFKNLISRLRLRRMKQSSNKTNPYDIVVAFIVCLTAISLAYIFLLKPRFL